jgi:uncharacterized protein (TIGR03437 family)
MKKQLILSLLAVIAASAAPVIRTGGVVNAASYIPLGTQGSGIAQGSYFVIFGSGLGPASISVSPLPFLNNLAGTTVTFTPATGSPVQAFLYYAVDGQVSGILPSSAPLGAANVTVSFGGATSAPAKVTIVKSNFGIFTMNQAGSGPAAILNLNSASEAPLNSLTSAAIPGQIMELFGTGLGPITGPDNDAPGVVSPQVDVKVLVAGQALTPLYAGRSPQYPGLDQINFQIPSDASIPDSCYVPVAIQANGFVSNYGTFAKATTGRTCSPPLGLSTAALQRLDQGAKVNVGLLSLSRSTILGSVTAFGVTIPINAATEQAGGTFATLDAGGIYNLIQTPGAVPPLNGPGTCLVQTQDSAAVPTSTIPPVPKPLNAGAKLSLSGPNSKAQDLPSVANIGYAAYLAQSGGTILGLPIPGVPTVPTGLPTTFLEQGQWTIKGTGGTDVGGFSATIAVPAPLNCSPSCDTTSIDRTQPLTIKWTGGGGSQDYVQVAGVASTASLADPTKNVAVLFECTAKASDGTLTVPVSVLSQMPTSSADPLAPNTGALLIINGLGTNTTFTAPLTAGGNLDAGYFGYSSVQTKLVDYK